MALTERTSDDLVSVGVVERNGIHHVSVALEREQLISRYGVPDLAGAVVAACDEFVAGLVEGAVRQRQDVCSQDLEQEEVAGLIAF